MIIRRAQLADEKAVLRIEQQSMRDPWSAAQVAAELVAVNGVGWVAESDGVVCGYVLFRFFAPESELLRLAVSTPWRRKGIGRNLLEESLRFLRHQLGCDCCFLEVSAANEQAQLLYLQVDFIQIGRRKAYYANPVEDAILLRRDLINVNGGCSEHA